MILPVTTLPEFFADKLGNPLGGGTLSVYNANTTTLAKVYSNVVGTQMANPITIPIDGRVDLFLEDVGYYDFLLKDKNGKEVWYVRGRGVGKNSGGGGGSVMPLDDSIFDQVSIKSHFPEEPGHVDEQWVRDLIGDITGADIQIINQQLTQIGLNVDAERAARIGADFIEQATRRASNQALANRISALGG
jgi:hypothetical protein